MINLRVPGVMLRTMHLGDSDNHPSSPEIGANIVLDLDIGDFAVLAAFLHLHLLPLIRFRNPVIGFVLPSSKVQQILKTEPQINLKCIAAY